MMRVAIYARVSKDEVSGDRRYQDPSYQIEQLRDWAKARGDIVHDVYIDKWSGADPNRPEFRRMMSEAMQRRFNAVLVWKLDRFSREVMSVQIAYIQRLKERGVGVCSLTESWMDTTKESPIGELVLAVMAWAASEERRKISERTKAGIARKRALGLWRGGRPKKGGGVPLLTPL